MQELDVLILQVVHGVVEVDNCVHRGSALQLMQWTWSVCLPVKHGML